MKRGKTAVPKAVCRHCLEDVEVQRTIFDGFVLLNADGSPHACPGAAADITSEPTYADTPNRDRGE